MPKDQRLGREERLTHPLTGNSHAYTVQSDVAEQAKTYTVNTDMRPGDPLEVPPGLEAIYGVTWEADGSWSTAPQGTLTRYMDDEPWGVVDCTYAPWATGTEVTVTVTWMEAS